MKTTEILRIQKQLCLTRDGTSAVVLWFLNWRNASSLGQMVCKAAWRQSIIIFFYGFIHVWAQQKLIFFIPDENFNLLNWWQLYGNIPPLSKKVKERLLRLAGHYQPIKSLCWRPPTTGTVLEDPVLKTLIEDAGVNEEELISCMQDRVVWRVRHRAPLKHASTDNLGRLGVSDEWVQPSWMADARGVPLSLGRPKMCWVENQRCAGWLGWRSGIISCLSPLGSWFKSRWGTTWNWSSVPTPLPGFFPGIILCGFHVHVPPTSKIETSFLVFSPLSYWLVL